MSMLVYGWMDIWVHEWMDEWVDKWIGTWDSEQVRPLSNTEVVSSPMRTSAGFIIFECI